MNLEVENGESNRGQLNGLKTSKEELRVSFAKVAWKTAACAVLLACLLYAVYLLSGKTVFWVLAVPYAAFVVLFALWLEARKQLRASNVLASVMTEVAGGCCWEWNAADKSFSLIPDGSSLFGKSVFTFDDFLTLIHPDDVSAFRKSVKTFYSAGGGACCGEPFAAEFRIQSVQGRWRWFSARSGFVEISGGLPIRATGGLLDIDEYRQAQETIRKSETRLSVIFQNAPGAMAVTDDSGKIEDVNQALCDMLGYSAEELRGVPIMSLSTVSREGEGRSLMEDLCLKLESCEDRRFHMEEVFIRCDGKRVIVDYGLSSILDYDGNVMNYIFSGADITLQKQHSAELDLLAEREREHARRLQRLHDLVHSLLHAHSREQLLRETLDYLEATISDSACSVYLFVESKAKSDSPKLERLTGYGEEGVSAPGAQVMNSILTNSPFTECGENGLETRRISPIFFQDRSVGAVEIRKPSGILSSELEIYRLLIDYISGFWTLYDILAQREEEASVDPLTGVWNRRYMIRRLQEENDRITRYGGNACLMIGDMGNFKYVNDTYGHVKGDEVLIKTALTIRDNLRLSDSVGRYGGDEFLLLLTNIIQADADIVLHRIQSELSQMKILSDDADPSSPLIPVVMDFGMAFYPYGALSLVDTITMADEAMYANKIARKEQLKKQLQEKPDPALEALLRERP
ncbi:MAG: diguanylate cyclase [Synergistaceae bacterium]|jgi:diguanylate cyclase (GGDEF)-like protein/PAS domain S-box-containing protein|nr:diguanylate cyclase [Synergistaceae bacterium]